MTRSVRVVPLRVMALGILTCAALIVGSALSIISRYDERLSAESFAREAQIDARSNDLRGQVEEARAQLHQTDDQIRAAIEAGDQAAVDDLNRTRFSLATAIDETSLAASAALAGRADDAAIALERAQSSLSGAISDVTARLSASASQVGATVTSLDARMASAEVAAAERDRATLESLTGIAAQIEAARTSALLLVVRLDAIEGRTASMEAHLAALGVLPDQIAALSEAVAAIDADRGALAQQVAAHDAADARTIAALTGRITALDVEVAVLRELVIGLRAAVEATTTTSTSTTATSASSTTSASPTTTPAEPTLLRPATSGRAT